MSYFVSEEVQLVGNIEEVNSYCKVGKLKEAVQVLSLMEKNKASTTPLSYLTIVEACGEERALTEAKLVHNHLKRCVPHLNLNEVLSNKILEMYSECGSSEDAYKWFKEMRKKNISSWNTMIRCYAKNGQGNKSIDIFNKFISTGQTPNGDTFLDVLCACSVLGDIKGGLMHLESMTKTYNLKPMICHYESVVDMYGGAGYLQEALQFIENLPIEQSAEIWYILMIYSRVHGDLELGERCFEAVNLLDPSLLDESDKEGLVPLNPSDPPEEKKMLGECLLDVTPESYGFVAGDINHPEHDEIYAQLMCLTIAAIEAGYKPDPSFVMFDIDEESKVTQLITHSERLVLSFLCRKTPARTQIRIIKNLRACRDCHEFFKIISVVLGRTIVTRDKKRFHHFVNGECACGGLW